VNPLTVLEKPSPLKISNPLEILARKASSSQIRESSLEFGKLPPLKTVNPLTVLEKPSPLKLLICRLADSQQFVYDPKVPIS